MSNDIDNLLTLRAMGLGAEGQMTHEQWERHCADTPGLAEAWERDARNPAPAGADAAHTPGPWTALPWEAEAGGKDWCVWGPKPSNHINDHTLFGDYGSEADARLIAAAPDLLAALREARADMEAWAAYAPDYFREKHDIAGDLAKIDAALAKATTSGGQP